MTGFKSKRQMTKEQTSCRCAECGKKDADGWALYCVDCMEKINVLMTVQPVQEPVAWRVRRHDAPNYWIVFLHKPVDAMQDPEREVQALYTAPPQRPWVGLTEEEISNFVNVVWPCELTSADYVRAIEQALKEKNT